MVKLITELQNRLPTNINIFSKIDCIAVDHALKHNKRDIQEVVKMFIQEDSEIDKIVNQWNNIHLVKWTNTSNTYSFWLEVFDFKNAINENPFQELSDMALQILSLPFSNAYIERTFSIMNNYKTKTRNRMSLKLLNSIMQIKYGLSNMEKCCRNIEYPTNILKEFETADKYNKNIPYAVSLTSLTYNDFPDDDDDDD